MIDKNLSKKMVKSLIRRLEGRLRDLEKQKEEYESGALGKLILDTLNDLNRYKKRLKEMVEGGQSRR